MVNATFAPLSDVQRLVKAWIEVYSERVRGFFLDRENQEFMKVIIKLFKWVI